MKQSSFEKKVKSMKGSEIIRAMLRGLAKEHVRVRMCSFGEFHNGICFGCAATNTVCEISGIVFTPMTIDVLRHGAALNADPEFVYGFEGAIDSLRNGWLDAYNNCAEEYGFALIFNECVHLSAITTDNYKDSKIIAAYEDLAKFNEKKGN